MNKDPIKPEYYSLRNRNTMSEYRKWTEKETNYLIQNYGDKTMKEIAKELGIEKQKVSNKINRLKEKGVELNRDKRSKISETKLKEELENGLTYKEIAYKYGYPYPSRALSDKMRELGYTKLETLNKRDQYGGTQIYINGDLLDKAIKQKGLENAETICRKVFVNEKGNIEHELTEKEWAKKDLNNSDT